MIGTVEGFTTFADERGWGMGADELSIAQALQRASDYILNTYVARFPQGFDYALDANVVAATYHAARKELETPDFWTRIATPGFEKELVGVGDIRWQIIGGAGNGVRAPVSTLIENILSPYLTASSVRMVSRA
jgi:hypothetical protein